jgi:hypothetical protein
MRQKLMTYISALWSGITGAAAAVLGVLIATPVVVWGGLKKIAYGVKDFVSDKWRLLALAVGLSGMVCGLYYYHMHAFEQGRRIGQCETGCWVMQGEFDRISDNGACVCVGDSFLFQQPEPLKN